MPCSLALWHVLFRASISASNASKCLDVRSVRTERTSKHLLAFEAEMEALKSTCQSANEQGMTTISTHQLSDLRLGERTRRIFQDAGLLYVQDVANLPS